MDGKFVPNLSFTKEDYLYVRSFSTLPMDVHIMVENPDDYVDFYGKMVQKYSLSIMKL